MSYGDQARVSIAFTKRGSRKMESLDAGENDTRYLTVEIDDDEAYCSLNDLHCDLEKWEETARRFPGGAMRSVSK